MTTPPAVSVAADYLGGHPGDGGPVDDGTLTVDGAGVHFAGSRVDVVTPTRVDLTVPVADVVAVSVLARGEIDTAAPLVRATALLGVVGAFMQTTRTQRDRLLLVRLPGGDVASFALTAIGAARVGEAVQAACGDLPEALPAGAGRLATDSEILLEIRDLLARQVQLLEGLAARLAR